jgi:hypothetical protein
MRSLKTALIFAAILIMVSSANAQRTEISIGFSEQFFDTVLDAMFSGAPPEFPIARAAKHSDGIIPASYSADGNCRESIRMQRESAGVRTAVRFRGGQIIAPLAFNGSYNPPLVGCVDFAGWAESVIDLKFDESGQKLTGTARVVSVNLNGTGGLGSSVIAQMVQSAIDAKINPIEIVKMDKISFMLPVQNSANLRMKAVGVRHEIKDGQLTVYIAYDIAKV